MCGRYGLTIDPVRFLRRMRATPPPELPFVPRYNVAPTQSVLAVLNDAKRSAMHLRWGLVPPTTPDPATMKLTTFNARIETIATAPAYRDAVRRTRCVVPATGYYEWQRRGDGEKRPMWIAREDGEPFGFAGLWTTWRRGDRILRSCTIVTRPPNDFVRPIHDRMPAVLADEAADAWLAVAPLDASAALAILRSQPSEGWTAHAVSKRIGTVANDDAELIAPVEDAPPPEGPLRLF